MKYAILLVFVLIVVLAILGTPAQAGKPTPYPPPGGDFEAQAYPAPSFPFPGNPPPNKGYVWGMYYTDTWRWYVSKYTASADPDATVMLCTAQEDPYTQICFRHRTGYDESLEYMGYDGMSWYRSIPVSSIPVSPCGGWGAMPDTSRWNGETMELHQPNWYVYPCAVWANPIYLPFVRKP